MIYDFTIPKSSVPKTYYFRAKTTAPSNKKALTTEVICVDVPKIPYISNVANVGVSGFVLNFRSEELGVTSYDIAIATSSKINKSDELRKLTTPILEYKNVRSEILTISGLIPQTDYYCQVMAKYVDNSYSKWSGLTHVLTDGGNYASLTGTIVSGANVRMTSANASYDYVAISGIYVFDKLKPLTTKYTLTAELDNYVFSNLPKEYTSISGSNTYNITGVKNTYSITVSRIFQEVITKGQESVITILDKTVYLKKNNSAYQNMITTNGYCKFSNLEASNDYEVYIAENQNTWMPTTRIFLNLNKNENIEFKLLATVSE